MVSLDLCQGFFVESLEIWGVSGVLCAFVHCGKVILEFCDPAADVAAQDDNKHPWEENDAVAAWVR